MRKKTINRWIILCFAGIFFLSLTISALANFQENYRAVMARSNADMERCAVTANLELKGVDFENLLLPENAPVYNDIRTDLVFCAGMFDVDKLFVYHLDPETRARKVFFIVSPDPATDQDYQEEMTPGMELDDPTAPVEDRWLAGEKDVSGPYGSGRESYWIHAFRDGHNNYEYMVAIENDVMLEKQEILRNFIWDILPIGLTLLGGMIILLVLVRRRIIQPIAVISESMSRFAGDGSRKPEPLRIRYQDEIGQIASVYNKMTTDISAYVGSIERLNREKLEAKVQLDIARKIQYGLVPEKTTLHGVGFRACAMTRPAREVSGDFYDLFQRDEQSICIVMGDVSGKGTIAAIFMAMTKTMIREKLMAGLSPAEALNQVNDELCGQNPEGMFTTVFAAVLNPQSGELRYANAGHTRPVLLGKPPSFLNPDPGIALGLFKDADLKNHELCLGPSEGILLYTDGVTEAVNPRRQFFGEQRLLNTAEDVSASADAEKILSGISNAVTDFNNGGEPFDDMAVLVLLRMPAENDDMEGSAPLRTPGEIDRQTIPVALSSFEKIKQSVFALAGDTRETRMALLACDEALTNIVNYSGATELAFSCEKQNGGLCISFFDNGIPFDPTAVGEEKEFEELDSGGMGLKLIRQNASGMRYERRPNRNELILNFNL